MKLHRSTYESIRRQRGLSLVELMVAITISLILLTGVVQIFLSSKTSYRLLEATSRVQENGRFAIGFLTKDIRMAGFMGCFRGNIASVETILNNPNAFNWDYTTAIQGNEWTGAGWSPALPALIAGQVVNGTDVIVTRGLSDDGIDLVFPYSDSSQLFVDPSGNNIVDGDILMVTDCSRASIFQTTNQQNAGGKVNIVHSSAGGWVPGNTGPLLTNSFAQDAQVARLVTNAYYIGTGASGSPALFRQSLISGGTMQSQELVDDVENMQVLYGEDLDGDDIANRYVSVDNVGDLDNVVSVRISLLLRTGDNITSAAQTYTYDDTESVAGDRRMRRIFNSTIKIRNRGLL